jgi:hypothetical protein
MTVERRHQVDAMPQEHPMSTRIPVALAAVAGGAALSMMLFSPAAIAGVPTATTMQANDSATGTRSADWAGWDVTGSTYTSVSASWVQPTVTCTAGDTSYSAFWVGLDGDGSESVEQIGTSSDCDSGTPTYSAWYEFYPSDSVQLSDKVKAGDKISARVSYDQSGRYTLKLTDSTQGWTDTKTGSSPQGTNASAEVIAEAPSSSRQADVLPLANFKTVDFTDVTVNGQKLTDLDGTTKIDMATQSGSRFGNAQNSAATVDTMATTSDLTSSGGFAVNWVSSGSDSTTSDLPGGTGWPGSSGSGSQGQGSGSTGTQGDGSQPDPYGDGSTGTQGDGSQTDPYSDGSAGWPGFDDIPWGQLLDGFGGWGSSGDSTTPTDPFSGQNPLGAQLPGSDSTGSASDGYQASVGG